MATGPRLPSLNTLIQAGIDPRTGLPLKITSATPSALKGNIAKLLTVIDEQDALNRFTWYNLPEGLDGNLIERILYYRGQAAFFYMPTNETFYFLPYALDGTIDVYGRYMGITPVPFNGTASDTKDGKQIPWIKGLIRKPVNEIKMLDDLTMKDWEEDCVLLHDYCKGIGENIAPRSELNRPLIEVESELIPFMRTALMASTGVAGMRVNSEDEQANVKAAAASTYYSALNGERWVPMVGSVDFQDLSTSSTTAANDFMLAMNSIDNLRLSTYGLDNGGMFEKQGTILQSEQASGDINTGLILNDGIKLRQNFCNIINSIWGLGIWCEITQPATLQPSQDMGGRDEEQTGQDSTVDDEKGGNENDGE